MVLTNNTATEKYIVLINVYCDETIYRSRVFEWDEMYLDSRGNLHDEPKTAKNLYKHRISS